MKACSNDFCPRNCKQHPAMKRWGAQCMSPTIPCSMEGVADSANVINVLGRPLKDGERFIGLLTSEEVEYCLSHEKRRGGMTRLMVRRQELAKQKENDSQRGGCRQSNINIKQKQQCWNTAVFNGLTNQTTCKLYHIAR